MTATDTTAAWRLIGTGYEFCNCQPGCTCNFSGFPTSPDGSCKAAVGVDIKTGHCGSVDLGGIKSLAIIDWPGPIHEGNGKVVFVVPPSVTDEQLGSMAQIFTGQLGGMPWSILGSTYEVAGVVRAEVEIQARGLHSSINVPGVGTMNGTTLKNPVTGEDNNVAIVLEHGFIWKRGDCGQGTFEVGSEGIHLHFEDTNWILYDFDWTNQS